MKVILLHYFIAVKGKLKMQQVRSWSVYKLFDGDIKDISEREYHWLYGTWALELCAQQTNLRILSLAIVLSMQNTSISLAKQNIFLIMLAW